MAITVNVISVDRVANVTGTVTINVGLIEVGIVYTVIDRIRNTIEIGVRIRLRFRLGVGFGLIGQAFASTVVFAAQTRVGVLSTVDRVFAVIAEDSVVASATAEFVSPGATEYQVGTVVAFEQVIAVLAANGVGAVLARD